MFYAAKHHHVLLYIEINVCSALFFFLHQWFCSCTFIHCLVFFCFICHKRNKLLLHVPLSLHCGYRCHVLIIIMWIVYLSCQLFHALILFRRLSFSISIAYRVSFSITLFRSAFLHFAVIYVLYSLLWPPESTLFLAGFCLSNFVHNNGQLSMGKSIFRRVTLMHSSFCWFFFSFHSFHFKETHHSLHCFRLPLKVYSDIQTH